jgi:hypothetical protein
MTEAAMPTATAPKPRTARPRRTRPNLKLVANAAKSAEPAPATRPLLNRSSTFVRDLQVQLREAEGEINLIDATEARATRAFDEGIERLDANYQEAVERLRSAHAEAVRAATATRDAEKLAQSRLRAEFAEIHERCTRALSDDERTGE